MRSWADRIRDAARPLHPTDAVGPLLARLDAYAGALREHGFDARWMGRSGGDAVVVLYFARDGHEGASLAFRVLREGLHEIRPGSTTWTTVESLEARLLHLATHTGACAWLLAGHGTHDRPGAPKDRVYYVDGPLVPLDPLDLVPTRPAPAAAFLRRLVDAFDGLERFSPRIDELLAVLDDVAAMPTRDSGVSVSFYGAAPGNPDPGITGTMSSIVEPTYEVSWPPLHFEVGRTGLLLRSGGPVLTDPAALREHLEQAFSTQGRGLAAELRQRELRAGTLRIGAHEVTLRAEARTALWRALWAGEEAVGHVGVVDPDALLETVHVDPVVRLAGWGRWTLDPARCRRLSDDEVALVGTGEPSFRRMPLFPGRTPSEPTAWSETLPVRLGPVPIEPGVEPWLAALCAAADTLPDVRIHRTRSGGPDGLHVLRLWCASGTARASVLRSGEVLTNGVRLPPVVDEAGALGLAGWLADRVRPGDPPRPDPKRRVPRAGPFSIDPERVAAALARVAPDPGILAETVRLLESSAPLAAWWRHAPWDGALELQVRSADSGEHVGTIVRLGRTTSDPDALRASILAQLEGGIARQTLRKIAWEREQPWLATHWCHRPPVWMARPVYQELVASLLGAPAGARTTVVRMQEPERWAEPMLGWGPIPIAGLELSPTSVTCRGKNELILVGPVRFVAARDGD